MERSTYRIAWRNLGRNRKRTLLAVAAIAIGQFVIVFFNGFMEGMLEDMLATVTGPLMGHVQVHHEDWRDERAIDLYVDDLAETRKAIAALPTVTNVSPRIYTAVLAAPGAESDTPGDAEPGMIVGLDVEVERQEGGILDSLEPSELPGGRGVALGKVFARKLGLKAGDLIAIIGMDADEFPVSDLFEVRAVIRKNVDVVNRMGIVMALEDAQEFLALGDQAHEIIIQGEDRRKAAALAGTVARLPSLEHAEVLPWREAVPMIAMWIDMAGMINLIIVGIVFLVAAAGIANTMTMSTFERSREFGMLLALGTRPSRLVQMILVEAVVLGLLGVAIGSALGSALVIILSHTGLDYSVFASGTTGQDMEFAFEGYSFSFLIYPKFAIGHVIPGVVAVTLVSIVTAAWPAALTARLQPVEAMRS